MTPFEAYSIFHSVKLHFTTDSYDYFRYGGKINVSPSLFETKKEKPFFIRLSKKYPNKEIYQDFCVANLFKDKKIWVNFLLSEDANSFYKRWLKDIQSLTYNFKEDLVSVFQDPGCLKADYYIQPRILDPDFPVHHETIVILDLLSNLFPTWDKKLKGDDIFWPIIKQKYLKYKPFLQEKIGDIGPYKKILLDIMKEMR